MIERETARKKMRVRVVEARQHRAALRVDHGGLCPTEALNLTIRPDPDHLVAAHGDRVGQLRAVAGIDTSVDNDQIDRAIIFALGANDETGDEGDADNTRHQICHEAGRHQRILTLC